MAEKTLEPIYCRFKVYFNGYEVRKWLGISIDHSYGTKEASSCIITLPYTPFTANFPFLTLVTVTLEYIKDKAPIEKTIFIGYPASVNADKRLGVVSVSCFNIFDFLSRIPILLLDFQNANLTTLAISSFLDGASIFRLSIPRFDSLIDVGTIKVKKGKISEQKSEIRKNIIKRVFQQLRRESKKLSRRKYMYEFVYENQIYDMFDFAYTSFDSEVVVKFASEELIRQLMQGTGGITSLTQTLLDYVDSIFMNIFRYTRVGIIPRMSESSLVTSLYIPMESYYELPPAFVLNLASTESRPYFVKSIAPTRLIAVSEMLGLTEAGEKVEVKLDKGKTIPVQTLIVAPHTLYNEVKQFLKDAKKNLEELRKKKVVNVKELPSKALGDIAIASVATNEETLDGITAGTFTVPIHLKALAVAFGKKLNSGKLGSKKKYFIRYIEAAAENYYRMLRNSLHQYTIEGLLPNPSLTVGFPILLIGDENVYYGAISNIKYISNYQAAPYSTIQISNIRVKSISDFEEDLFKLADWCITKGKRPTLDQFYEIFKGNHLWYPLDLNEEFIPTRFTKGNYRDVAVKYCAYKDRYDIYSRVMKIALDRKDYWKKHKDELKSEIHKEILALKSLSFYGTPEDLKTAMEPLTDVIVEDNSEWPDKDGKEYRENFIKDMIYSINAYDVKVDID